MNIHAYISCVDSGIAMFHLKFLSFLNLSARKSFHHTPMGTLLMAFGTKEKKHRTYLLAERDVSGRTITLIPEQIRRNCNIILHQPLIVRYCQLIWIAPHPQPPHPLVQPSFFEVYEELLRPFGGRIPKRVKTQVAAAAELGDVKVHSGNWNCERHETDVKAVRLRLRFGAQGERQWYMIFYDVL